MNDHVEKLITEVYRILGGGAYWCDDIRRLVDAAEAERKQAKDGERVGERVVEIAECEVNPGGCRSVRQRGRHSWDVSDRCCLRNVGMEKLGAYAIRPLPEKPKVLRPWLTRKGFRICAACHEECGSDAPYCLNSECRQYGHGWGDGIPLPDGEPRDLPTEEGDDA